MKTTGVGRTGSKAETDGRTVKDETDIAEEPTDMLGSAVGDDDEDDVMAF
jgi:hypothetical protein